VIFMWFRLLRREVELARDAELGLVEQDDADEAGGATGESEDKTDGDRADGDRAGLVS
jgi:hypothetical protein